MLPGPLDAADGAEVSVPPSDWNGAHVVGRPAPSTKDHPVVDIPDPKRSAERAAC